MQTRKSVTRLLLSLALCGTLSSSLLAQTMVSDPSGFTTQAPANYQVRQDTSGTLITNPEQTFAIVLKPHTYATFEAFAADANLERDGFQLVGEVRALEGGGRHFRAAKANGEGGYIIADTFVTFSGLGGGALVVALASQDQADTAYQAANQVVSGLRFSQQAAVASGNPWDAALRGRHLLYLYTGNGYSERRDLYLLANGTFVSRNDASSLSMNGSGAMAGGNDGRWQITANGQLVLQHHDGNSQVYTLAQREAGNEVSLNGQRYFVMSE